MESTELNRDELVRADKRADDLIDEIKEALAEYDRMEEIAEAKIADIKEKLEEFRIKTDAEVAYRKELLRQYFAIVPHKETKTQESYKLLSGTLVMKKPKKEIAYDAKNKEEADALLSYLLNSGANDFIEYKTAVKWCEYKKTLMIDGDKVIDTATGEVTPLGVRETAAEFFIKSSS